MSRGTSETTLKNALRILPQKSLMQVAANVGISEPYELSRAELQAALAAENTMELRQQVAQKIQKILVDGGNGAGQDVDDTEE